MRLATLAIAFALLLSGCKDDKSAQQTPQKPAPAAPERTPEPSAKQTERAENNDHKDIQGTWQTESAENPVQLEFRDGNVIERAGPGPNWKLTLNSKFTLQNRINPSQIDWGTGATARYGLYTIDGKNLIISYGVGSPDSRPKRLDQRKPPYTQLMLKKQ